MTTPGSFFPVVGPGGVQKWWVVPEGFLGQLQNALTTGPALHVYTVKESVNRPSGAVAGPYTTQGQAQAQANTLNAQNTATIPHVAQQSAQGTLGDLAQRLTQSSTWQRVGEVIAGFVLLYVGLKALFPQAVNTVVQPVKNTATGTFKAAKMGLI